MHHDRPSLVRAHRALLALALLAAPALAQRHAPESVRVPYRHDTGARDNPSAQREVVASFTVHLDDTAWLRLYFERVELAGDPLAGDGGLLRITSHADGYVQELDARHVEQWRRTSAYFNGGTVQVDLVAPPGPGTSRVVLAELDAGRPPVPTYSQCGGTDDRTLASDPRVARLMPIGCTGWMIEDCRHCFLTAGHCMGGGLTVAEFHVPLSSSGGSVNHPSPDDQYAIDPASLQGNGGNGVGDDWAYFGAFANSNTGLTPYEAEGAAFALATPPPAGTADARVTGYGGDGTPPEHNQVLQTHAGPLVTVSGTSLRYVADTEGGNSGSPVIWEQTGQAIGIHTHGGCSTDGTGSNAGTAYGHTGLGLALAAPQGVCGSGLVLPQPLPGLLAPGAAAELLVDVLGAPLPGSVQLHWRSGGGSFAALPMSSLGGTLWRGELPAQACGDAPELFFSYQDASCGLLTLPEGAPLETFAATVGSLTPTLADDFEADLGWTTEVLGASSGQWQRGVPVNDPSWTYAPASDADGSGSCWLTQNELGNTDVDGGAVRLTSPAFDLSQGEAWIEYEYYLRLTVDDGADRLLVEASDGGAWATVATHDGDGGTAWRRHVLTAADLAGAGVAASATTRVRFTANDGGSASVVEAGVDAFVAGRFACEEPVQALCFGDGSGAACPCGNTGAAGAGCASSTGAGAVLGWAGGASVAADDLVLLATQAPANRTGLFLQGATTIASPFRDGILCTGDPTERLEFVTSDGSGAAATSVSIVTEGLVVPGQTRTYQLWFRDGMGPCGNGSNLSGALLVRWE